MSRYAFEEIVTNARDFKELKDTKGYTMSDWIDIGIIGYSESKQTYFIHFDNDQDIIPWVFGRDPNEVTNFEQVISIIEDHIFKINNGELKFSNIIEKKDFPMFS